MFKKIIFMVLLTWFLFGCAVAEEKNTGCDFEYSETLKNQLIIPQLKLFVGNETYRHFNYDSPYVKNAGKDIQIRLNAVKTVDDKRLMFESTIVIVVNSCTGELQEAYLSRYQG